MDTAGAKVQYTDAQSQTELFGCGHGCRAKLFRYPEICCGNAGPFKAAKAGQNFQSTLVLTTYTESSGARVQVRSILSDLAPSVHIFKRMHGKPSPAPSL